MDANISNIVFRRQRVVYQMDSNIAADLAAGKRAAVNFDVTGIAKRTDSELAGVAANLVDGCDLNQLPGVSPVDIQAAPLGKINHRAPVQKCPVHFT